MTLKNLFAALALAGSVALIGCTESKDKAPAAGGGSTGGAAATSTGGDAKPAPATSGGSSSSSMSDDEKHKLWQAAASSGDATAMMDLYKKLGFMKGNVPDTDAVTKFGTDHGAWAQKNLDFITKEVNTPEKAKAYWDAHK
jgi:hypothetical protein